LNYKAVIKSIINFSNKVYLTDSGLIMAIYLEGITVLEFKALIKESVSEQFLNVLKEQKENVSENTSKILTRKETAQKLQISLVTLHNWCLKGIIPSYRINTRIRFKSEDIDEILSNPKGLKYNTKR
jgi:predicted DNA-binding transcriptional regulator AlpA